MSRDICTIGYIVVYFVLMIERAGSFLHSHTYSGRYDQFMVKHAARLAETKGAERYDFEKRLDTDAKRYANKKVLQDVALIGSVALGAYAGVRIAREGWDTVVAKTEDQLMTIAGAVDEAIAQAITVGDRALEHLGYQVADGAGRAMRDRGQELLASVEKSAPAIGAGVVIGARTEIGNIVTDTMARVEAGSQLIGSNLADGATVRLKENLPGILETLEHASGEAGRKAGTEFMLSVMEQTPSLSKVLAESARAFGIGLFTGFGKKNG